MKNLTRPSFLTFIAGAVLMFIGIGTKANGDASGNSFLYIGIALMGIFGFGVLSKW